jgi:hypothetical protein
VQRTFDLFVAALALVGSLIGIAELVPPAFGGRLTGFVGETMLALMLALYGIGIWSGLQSFRRRANWQRVARLFWIAQIPLAATPVLSWVMFSGAGVWIFFRRFGSGWLLGWSGSVGNGVRWALPQDPQRFTIGVNVLALVITVVLEVQVKSSQAE